jgi:hypothetical protein
MRKKLSTKLLKVKSGIITEHDIYFVNLGCTYFFNAQHKFIHLSTIERLYFDVICEKMNFRNKIELNPSFRHDFINFCKRTLKIEKIRTGRSLQNMENKFKNLYLIFDDPEYKGLYYVNPKYVFKGTAIERKSLLNKITQLALYYPDCAKAITDVDLDSIEIDKEIHNLPFPQFKVE